jgi:hypothetical protein
MMSFEDGIVMLRCFDDGTVMLVCACGWGTPRLATWESAGREMDLHLAARFPRGTERKANECDGVLKVVG